MSDLNSYIMLKDHDIVPGGGAGKTSHHIGMNPPNNDDLLAKLHKF